MKNGDGETALALGGGGARAAYQAGVLRAIARRVPQARFPIITGVSAGAIATAILANHVGTFSGSVDALTSVWSNLEVSNVFRATPMSLLRRIVRTAAELTGAVEPGDEVVHGMVDTSALREFLQRELSTPDGSLPGIAENLRTGRLTAAAMTATRYATGESVTFCAGREIRTWNRPQRTAVVTDLTLDHVMASSAIPLFYPAIAVDGAWYGDGEMGLIAPLAPALHLGAGRILAISTWASRRNGDVAEPARHPAPGEVMSVLFGTVFADRLDHDAAQLERVNELVRGRPPGELSGCREAKLLVIRPSADLGAVACAQRTEIPRSLQFLARRLDLRRARSRDMLSVVMLDHGAIGRLLEIGEQDGDRRADEIAEFLES